MNISNYFELILLIGNTLTFLMSFFLWFYPRDFFANKVIGALVFFWAFNVTVFVLQSNEFYIKLPHILGIGTGITLLYFPLIYFYVKSYLYKDYRSIKKLYPHLTFTLLYFLIISPFYFQSGDKKIEIILTGLPHWLKSFFDIIDLTVILQGIIYTILSIRVIHHFQYFRKRKLSKAQLQSVKWLSSFIKMNAFLWAVGGTGAFLQVISVNSFIDLFKVYYLGLMFLTLWIGYITISKPHLFSETMENDFYETLNDEDPTVELNSHTKDLEFFLSYMEIHKPYLNNSISLQDLSDETKLSRQKISEVINLELNKSFYDVINEYRTKEAIRLIDENKHQDLTLATLAEMELLLRSI